jgi:hypothetical protein
VVRRAIVAIACGALLGGCGAGASNPPPPPPEPPAPRTLKEWCNEAMMALDNRYIDPAAKAAVLEAMRERGCMKMFGPRS